LVLLVVVTDQIPFGSRLDRTMLVAWAWISLFFSITAIPSIFFAARRLAGRSKPLQKPGKSFRLASLALCLFPLVLAVGATAGDHPVLVRFVFPLAAILAAGLPVWWMVEMTRQNAPCDQPQRHWGVFNFALFFSTPLAFLLEILIFVGIILVVGIWAAGDPRLSSWLMRFQQTVVQSGGDLEALQKVYGPVLRNPAVLLGIFSLLAVLIPMLEEMVKPLAVWFLLGRGLAPAAGLALGAIAGAGFALPETLLSLASASSDPGWIGLAIGRAGTSLLHVVTTAVTGMALAYLWGNRRSARRYLGLGAAYAAVVIYHGLWNGMAIAAGLAKFFVPEGLVPAMTTVGYTFLSIQALCGLVVLFMLSRRLNPGPNLGMARGAELPLT
jgi:hypothetical protein